MDRVLHNGELRTYYKLVLSGSGLGYVLIRNRDTGLAEWWPVHMPVGLMETINRVVSHREVIDSVSN